MLMIALGCLVLPLAGCFESDSSDRSRDRDRGRIGDRYDNRTSDRYDDRYNDRYDDRGGYGRAGDQSHRYREVDLVRIGTVTANNRQEQNDLLEIKTSERFKGILFEVDRGEVAVDHIRVTFDDDTAFEPQTATRFREGEQTRLIELPGNNRDIKRVRLKYRSISGGSSVITVYGLPTSYRGR